ncbi:protein ALP1-like [Elysia marginata]|uniref:Protein ALP1-like n=1 Tax=Elysia marginata TaxID=1093978 RepID=A0AAV4JDP6_9GAST|nr:protein ALP1-like [Elysia marginata]
MPSTQWFSFLQLQEFFSLQLQAVVEADLMFTAIDVGDFGMNSDGSVFKNSTFGELLNNKLDLPVAISMGLSGTKTPYCFVADEAYPLKDNFMRPYGGRNLDNPKIIFNQKLSRAPADYNVKFRNAVPTSSEDADAFTSRLETVFNKWLELSEVKEGDYEALGDLILRDQIYASLLKDIAMFLKERSPCSVKEVRARQTNIG